MTNILKKGTIFHIGQSEWIVLDDEHELGCKCKCTFSVGGFNVGDFYQFNSTYFDLIFCKHPQNLSK
jgi:hypothetical protein